MCGNALLSNSSQSNLIWQRYAGCWSLFDKAVSKPSQSRSGLPYKAFVVQATGKIIGHSVCARSPHWPVTPLTMGGNYYYDCPDWTPLDPTGQANAPQCHYNAKLVAETVPEGTTSVVGTETLAMAE
jgi:hypothetical protein